MLQVGAIIFNDESAGELGGLWWNPKTDLLIFDEHFKEQYEHFIFRNLGGLHHVRHIGLDLMQAQYLCF